MKFPLPELQSRQFTINQCPRPDAPRGAYRVKDSIDNGKCCACDKTYVRTCRVQGMPNLCQECYSWMRKYSQMDDPYKMKRIREGTPIEPEQIKKAIRYAKVKTMDVAGVTEMTTGAILLHAYKAYKDALDEGASEDEARARQTYIERQDALQRQAEMEEEARLQEHRQELLRKMSENQRILKAQQARLNRLAGRNVTNRSAGNIESKKQEVSVRIDEKEVPKQIEVEAEKDETKKAVFLKKYKVHIVILIAIFIISPQFRYIALLIIVFGIMGGLIAYIEQIIKRFK